MEEKIYYLYSRRNTLLYISLINPVLIWVLSFALTLSITIMVGTLLSFGKLQDDNIFKPFNIFLESVFSVVNIDNNLYIALIAVVISLYIGVKDDYKNLGKVSEYDYKLSLSIKKFVKGVTVFLSAFLILGAYWQLFIHLDESNRYYNALLTIFISWFFGCIAAFYRRDESNVEGQITLESSLVRDNLCGFTKEFYLGMLENREEIARIFAIRKADRVNLFGFKIKYFINISFRLFRRISFSLFVIYFFMFFIDCYTFDEINLKFFAAKYFPLFFALFVWYFFFSFAQVGFIFISYGKKKASFEGVLMLLVRVLIYLSMLNLILMAFFETLISGEMFFGQLILWLIFYTLCMILDWQNSKSVKNDIRNSFNIEGLIGGQEIYKKIPIYEYMQFVKVVQSRKKIFDIRQILREMRVG